MKIPKYLYGNPIEEWGSQWKDRLLSSARSKVLQKWNASGKKPKPESSSEYTKRRVKEETKRTWRSDAADIAHGIGEGALALHPYTAIPYYGAKVGQDVVNGNVNWNTALNASIPLFHLSPQAVGLREATNVALEDAANAGSKTARNWRVAREINLTTKSKPSIEVPKPIIRTRVGDIEIDNPQLFYRQGSAEMGNDFIKSGVVRTSGGFLNPMYTEGALFRKVPTRTKGGLSKGDKIVLDGPYSKNKSDLLVTDSSIDMIPADQGSGKNYAWFEDYMSDPFAEESIFDRSRVPLFDNTATSTNTTAYRWKPGYGYRLVVEEPSTSLKFFEKKPSRISLAERFGVPKGERNLSNIISKFGEPFTYDENGLFIPNPNYNFRNGWGLIEDAIKTGRIRVPEGDYKPAVLKKYPFLSKSVGSFSTVRDLSFKFPYFLRGESIWPFKTQVLAEDLIAIPNDLPDVSWNKVSKFNTIFEDEIANIGDKTTPIINGKSNIFPSDKALFFRLNKATNKYEPYEIIPTSEGWGVYSNKYNKGFSTTYFKYPNYIDEPINIKKKKQGGKMNTLLFLKNGSGIHIKKKNRGKFTDYCGGEVTQECINKGKHSSNPAIRKRATFAANARKWKHLQGGVMRAGDKARSNLTKRKNPNWNNIDRAYRYFTLDRGLDHNSAVALLGNIIEESRGFHDAFLKNGGGRGLIQWDGLPAPKGLYPQLKSIVDSVIMPANVYNPKTKEVSNYWKSTNGVKGDDVRKNFLNKKVSPTNKATLYAKAYLRPGKPRYKERELSTAQIDSIYNPKIRNILVKRNGGKAFVEGVNVLDSNPNAYKYVKKKYKMRMALEGAKFDWASTLANVGSSILQGYFLNKKASKEAEAAKAMNKFTSKDFFNIYNLKLQEAKLLEEQLAKAVEAMTGTTINSSNIVAANNAWKNASGEYAALKNNVDLQNRAIDAEAQALKSNIWGNAISGAMLQGMGLLNNYLNNKSSNATTPTTISTKTSYNYFSTPKKFGTFNNDGSINLGYNMTWSTDKGVQTKNWSDGIFNKSITDYLK